MMAGFGGSSVAGGRGGALRIRGWRVLGRLWGGVLSR